jgi:autotransporter translocation and assembly factor TamB
MASEAKNIDHIAVQRINRWHYPVALSLIFLLIATALTVWLASTSSGARASFRLLDLITAGQIKAIHIGGSFMAKLQIGQLTVTTPEEKITITNLKLDWRPWALADRLLRIDRLHIGTLLIQTSRQTAKPLRQLPSSLLLPFDVMLDRCDIDTISIQQAYQKLVTAEDLELSWRFEKTAHVFRLQRAQMTQLGNIHTDSHLKACLHLQASTPFSIQSDIQLQGTHKGWHLEATGHLGGVLSDIKTQMVVRLGQQQEQTQLSAQVQLQVLTPQIISAGELNAEQLDLSKINQDWPTTQMAVQIALSKKKKENFQSTMH